MKKARSKEEKLKLIEDFKASGLSMSKWCATNGIATSTMSTWLAKTSVLDLTLTIYQKYPSNFLFSVTLS